MPHLKDLLGNPVNLFFFFNHLSQVELGGLLLGTNILTDFWVLFTYFLTHQRLSTVSSPVLGAGVLIVNKTLNSPVLVELTF